MPVLNTNATVGSPPLVVTFVNDSTATEVAWDFGDGTTSTTKNPSHTYTKAGTYTVSLTEKKKGTVVVSATPTPVPTPPGPTPTPTPPTPTPTPGKWTERRTYDTPTVAAGQRLPEGAGDNKSQLSNRNTGILVSNAHTHPPGNGYKDSQQGYAVEIHQNPNAWNTLGISPGTNKGPKEGEEIWGRAWVYFPQNWLAGDYAHPKVLRLMAGGVGGDYFWEFPNDNFHVSWQGVPSGGGNASEISWWGPGSHVNGYTGGYVGPGTSPQAPKEGQWNCLEIYVKFSANASTGKFRFWLNETLLYDISGVTTGYYAVENSTPPLLAVFSNWDGLRQDHTFWADDIILTNDPAVAYNKDAKGNSMIGAQ